MSSDVKQLLAMLGAGLFFASCLACILVGRAATVLLEGGL